MSITTTVKKAARKVAGAVTGEEPQVDLLDTLKEEHEAVSALLKQLVESERAAERKSLLKKVKAALVPHVRAEEKILYDAILTVKDKTANQDGEEGYLEHGLADRMLATLGKTGNAMSPEFGAAAKVLKELVEHHVQEEESNLWSDAREHFSSDERKLMNQKYLRLKATVKVP
jgi:hemerythrin HHE cation binding domain-containing protein